MVFIEANHSWAICTTTTQLLFNKWKILPIASLTTKKNSHPPSLRQEKA